MITNSVDMTHKADKTKKYRKLAIKQKKDSRPIEELYSIEATNERLHLQRMILNVEYDNIVNKNKNNSLKRNNSFSRRRSFKRATSVKKTFFYKLAENKAIKYTKNNRINEIMAKYQKEREDIDLKYEHLRTSANNSRRENRKKASYLNVEQNNGIVSIKNIDGSFTIIDNPLNIEDLKVFLWFKQYFLHNFIFMKKVNKC